MQWTCRLCLPGALLIAIVACGKKAPPKPGDIAAKTESSGGPRDVIVDDGKGKDKDKGKGPITPPAAGDDDRFTAALEKAVDLYARDKYPEALEAFEDAQKIQKTDTVALEIAKIKSILDSQASAQRAIDDVRSVLEEGKADEAARLATTALEQYGDGDRADDLAKLKQQADAVVTAAADDPAERLKALKAEATAALKVDNLRAAVVALEQALELAKDEALSTRLESVRQTLATYDENRKKAAEYRRDTTQAEAALSRLTEAQKAWKTPQVQLEIDQVKLIAERRRDRVSVADFEVRGDVGEAGAGRDVAEDLLPHFKSRFDLVERAQLGKVLTELKLDATDLTESPASGREVARLARVRYVVVGSVTPLNGVTVRARLVEVATGLVVQTAKVSARTVAELDKAPPAGGDAPLKELARMLTMTDEERMAYEDKLQKAAVPVVAIADTEYKDFPPPPPPPEDRPAPPPPAIVTYTPRPPAPGASTLALVQQFERLPVVVGAPPPPPPALSLLLVREQAPRRHRLLRLSLELGDNLFRRRRYAEAQRHFSLALTLAGPRREIAVRLDACRRFAPPPRPLVIVVPPPVIIRPVIIIGRPAPPPVVVIAPPRVRPRLAVFGFVVNCRPQLVPTAMSDWAADQLAGYCGHSYELIDRGEVCWYMGRLNITMSDLLRDPIARRCLAQALGARYFVFGTITETASFNVSTTLMDAESGATTGQGKIHVQDQAELKLRMGELARQIGTNPNEQQKLAKQGAASEDAVKEARKLLQQDKPAEAAKVLADARKANPNSVAVNTLLGEAQRKESLKRSEVERRTQAVVRKKAEDDAKKRQQELARKAAAERIAASARVRTDVEKQRQEQQQAKAAGELQKQAAAATARGDHARAVQLLQSAAALRPAREVDDALGKARAAQRAAADKVALAAREKSEKAAQAARESAAKRVQAERDKQAKADAERKKGHADREKALHDGFLTQTRALMQKKDYAGAVAAAQSARRHQASDASANLLREAQDQFALAEAEKKGAAEKQRVAEEQKQRAAEAAATKKKQADYTALLTEGKKAIDAKKHAEAQKHYAAARKLFDTDVARSGETAAGRFAEQEKAAAGAAAKSAGRVKDLLGLGEKALAAKKYDEAVKHYREAGQIDRTNAAALAGLSRAERERDTAALLAKRAKQAAEDYKLALSAGDDATAKKNFQGAVNAYGLALKYVPNDPAAKRKLAAAQKALGESKKPKPDPKAEEMKKREVAYKAAMTSGDAALKGKRYAEAVQAYDAALKNKPGDAVAISGKKAAQKGLDDMKKPKPDPKAEEAKKREANYKIWLKAGDDALKGRKYTDAVKAYDSALQNKPGDAAAISGKKAAQKGLDDMKKPKPDPKAEEMKKKEAAYNAAMARGQTALQGKKYADAVKAYGEALTNKPGDKLATAGRDDAARLLKGEQDKMKGAEEAKKREAAYKAWLKQGDDALKGKKYADAVKAYDSALQNKPGDAAAVAGKKAAQKALDDMKKPKPDPKAEDAKKREAGYLGWMKAGDAAMTAKKYAEAVKAYDNALQNKPGDAKAIAAKKAATAAQQPAKPSPMADHAKAMQQAKTLETQGKYADAVTAYETALKHVAGDYAKNQALRTAQFNAYMGVGRSQQAAKKYADATKAYEEALKRQPTSAEAKAALARAKANKP